LKITIVQGAFFPVPPIRGGAIEKIWFALGKVIAARGHEVTHISRTFPDLQDDETIDGVRHLRVRGHDAPSSMLALKCYDLLYTLRALRLLRRLPRADLVVTNTFWLPLLVRSEKFGRLYVHVARYPRGQMRLYGHAARLQTVSQPIRDAIVHETPQLARRVSYVPNPVIRGAANSTTIPRRREVLYVGRLHPEKGVHLLIEAFARMPANARADWRLVIVGPSAASAGGGGEDYESGLRHRAGPLGESVEFVGPIYDATALDEFYSRAALFVYPSLAERGETFGVAPLEAMACGCPALVSDLACFREFLVEDVNGFRFDHRTADPAATLAALLAALLDDPARLAATEPAARRKADEFSVERVADLYLADFQAVLAGR
jgi:glycosyltransferase involved in cell wall biosynthesis